jgi:hypothetical protein
MMPKQFLSPALFCLLASDMSPSPRLFPIKPNPTPRNGPTHHPLPGDFFFYFNFLNHIFRNESDQFFSGSNHFELHHSDCDFVGWHVPGAPR